MDLLNQYACVVEAKQRSERMLIERSSRDGRHQNNLQTGCKGKNTRNYKPTTKFKTLILSGLEGGVIHPELNTSCVIILFMLTSA